MSTHSPSKWDQATDRKEEAVRRRAQVLLNDSSHDWLRTRRARRTIVVVYVGVVIAMITMMALSWVIPGLLALGVWLVLLIALRSSVRTQADLPDYALDERQIAERDRTYLGAFRLVAGVVLLSTAVAFFVVVVRDRQGTGSIRFDFDDVSAVFWGVTALLTGSPSLVLAWSQSNRAH